MRRSKYNQEFKDSAVKLCIDSDKSITSIARDLGLNKGTLSLWVSKYKDSNTLTTGSKISKESLEEENKRLKTELAIGTARTRYFTSVKTQCNKSLNDLCKKGNSVLCKRNYIGYDWIKENTNSFKINLMCKVLKVSRSCYDNWIDKGIRGIKVDKQLNDLIKDLFIHSRQTYGTRRLKESLVQNYGLVVSRKLITKR